MSNELRNRLETSFVTETLSPEAEDWAYTRSGVRAAREMSDDVSMPATIKSCVKLLLLLSHWSAMHATARCRCKVRLVSSRFFPNTFATNPLPTKPRWIPLVVMLLLVIDSPISGMFKYQHPHDIHSTHRTESKVLEPVLPFSKF